MPGRIVRGTTPRHLQARNGRGWAEDRASGFITYPERIVDDVRQGYVDKCRADMTPGFGTHHPQDVKNLPVLDDPKPVEPITSPNDTLNLSVQDLSISDTEVRLSIQEGRRPREGF